MSKLLNFIIYYHNNTNQVQHIIFLDFKYNNLNTYSDNRSEVE